MTEQMMNRAVKSSSRDLIDDHSFLELQKLTACSD